MSTFFLDLWQDLRAKRLWPVAVALLVATLAVPVFLLNSAAKPSRPAAPSASRTATPLPLVRLDQVAESGSRLDVFAARDPFRPIGAFADGQSDAGDAGDVGEDQARGWGYSFVGGASI